MDDFGREFGSFLRFYTTHTDPIIDKLEQGYREEARSIGVLPDELVRMFFGSMRRGKRMRGALAVLVYRLFHNEAQDGIYRTSLALEALHTGFLIHDDIMDRDELRRGAPAVHVQLVSAANSLGIKKDSNHFALSQAILTGSLGYFLAYRLLGDSAALTEGQLQAAHLLSSYASRVVYGQSLDVLHAYIPHVTNDELRAVYIYKTAEYSGVLPLLFGAALAGRKGHEECGALQTFGLSVGWMFQLTDDLLGVYGDPAVTGKPVGSDIAEKKQTVLVWFVCEQGDKTYSQALERTYKKDAISSDDIRVMQDMFTHSGARAYAEKKIEEHAQKAQSIVPLITKNPNAQHLLLSFIEFVRLRKR